MSLESEYGIDEKMAAAIADHFRGPDRKYLLDPDALGKPIQDYFDKFGRINFAALEQIFRKEKFNAHFLAIPARLVEPQNPQILVADASDMFFEGKITPRPFVAISYPSLEDVVEAAYGHGFQYKREKNMTWLKSACSYVANPNYHGNLSSRLIVVQAKASRRGPFSAN